MRLATEAAVGVRQEQKEPEWFFIPAGSVGPEPFMRALFRTPDTFLGSILRVCGFGGFPTSLRVFKKKCFLKKSTWTPPKNILF